MINYTQPLNKRQQQLELISLLEEKKRRQSFNPLKYHNPYLPKRHKKQIEAHESDKLIRVLFWGNRVGKTEWGGMETSYFVTGSHEYRDIFPPIEAWVGCPSFELQPEGTQAKLEKYLPNREIDKIEYLRGKIWKSIRLKNGSNITFKSYEQGREKWQSAGKDLIWFDEEPPSDIWEEAMVRQEAGRDLNIIMTMTPVKGMTWVYDDIWLDTSNPYLFTSQAGWDDNPYLDRKQIEIMSRNIKSEEMLMVRRKGLFVNRVGLVCNWWRREKNMRDYDKYPEDWQYYETIDPGWSDPTAYLFIGVDNDGNVHVLDGFRKREMHEDEIFRKREYIRGDLIVRYGITDNDQPRMNDNLNNLGMNVVPIKKILSESYGSWDEGLANALSYFGKDRLFVNKKLKWLVQEIENLKWLEQNKKTGLEIKPKWDDHRRFKHHFDGIRSLAYLFISEAIEPIDSTDKDPLGLKDKIPGTFIKPSSEFLKPEEEDSFYDEGVAIADQW